MKKPKFTSGYLHNALGARKKVIEKTVKGIRDSKVKFDAIAFTGLSGTLIAPAVADKLKKPIIAVRKGKNNHSNCYVEGCHNLNKYIIVDDQIETGATIKTIQRKIKRDGDFKHYELVAVFLYNTGLSSEKLKEWSKYLGVTVRSTK